MSFMSIRALGRSPFSFYFVLCSYITLTSFCFQYVYAQVLVNGQLFTNGLSIINAPASNASFTATTLLPISIDVSGNGQLSPSAAILGSGLPTRYDELNIFLVSSETNTNATLSSGPKLLTGGKGSVRTLVYTIPSCIPSGKYNLTFYETAHIEGNQFFTITAIPITIANNNPSGDCGAILNPLQAQPQASAPFNANEPYFLPSSAVYGSTVVATSSRFLTVITTQQIATSPTVVVVSVATVTTTASGQSPTSSPSPSTTQVGEFSGFVPVNSSKSRWKVFFGSWHWALWPIAMVLASF